MRLSCPELPEGGRGTFSRAGVDTGEGAPRRGNSKGSDVVRSDRPKGEWESADELRP